jgi:hypothetical protein
LNWPPTWNLPLSVSPPPCACSRASPMPTPTARCPALGSCPRSTSRAPSQRHAGPEVARSPSPSMAWSSTEPVFVADVVSCYAEVIRVGRTSLNVRVEVFAECDRIRHACVRVTEATITLVALDEHGAPKAVPTFEDNPWVTIRRADCLSHVPFAYCRQSRRAQAPRGWTRPSGHSSGVLDFRRARQGTCTVGK